jgi:polyhydroxybutyrate depolymerase
MDCDAGLDQFMRIGYEIQDLRKSWLYVFAFLTVAVSACGGSTAAAPTPSTSPTAIHHATVTVSGVPRTYTVFRPPSLDPAKLAPLVVALHGYTSNASEMETSSRFDDQATQGSFMVVYPQGLGNSWNAGRCCGQNGYDDVAFISALIDRMVSGSHVDAKRVFVTGMSNGGLMAQRLACDLSDRVTAVASVSGGLVTSTCKPTRPISVMEIHGTADSLVPFAGGSTAGLTYFAPTISVMAHWATLDGCAASPTVTQSGIARTSTWTGCRGGAQVVLKAVLGGQHSWFGPDADPRPDEPNATQVVWDFFSHVPTR